MLMNLNLLRKSLPALLFGLGILIMGAACFTLVAWTLSPGKGVIDVPDMFLKILIGCVFIYCAFTVPMVLRDIKRGKTLWSRDRKT